MEASLSAIKNRLVSGRLLAVIPARGGSKGLSGKNIRMFAGMPLIGHTILLARMCRRITRAVVSTDSETIANVSRKFGADIPFLRPGALARDHTPMWPVLRHALDTIERMEMARYDYLLLLDPTTPCRLPADIVAACRRLEEIPRADGIIGVSRPPSNPIWSTVLERKGWMNYLVPGSVKYTSRQEVPVSYRVNGALYIWRTSFVRREKKEWRNGKHLMHEFPDFSTISIDTLEQFQLTELMVRHGLVKFPWLGRKFR